MPEIQNYWKSQETNFDVGMYLRYLRKDRKLQDWEAQLCRWNIVFKDFQAFHITNFFPKSVGDLFLAVESQKHSIIEEFGLERTF